jgi:predicted metal-dependent phosphoesterase TrpH
MIEPFKYDLHIHSNCSDGTYSPAEILHLAKQQNLKGLSITDHDTIAAYSPELFAEANELGLTVLTGVEFSAIEKETTVHILGYGFDWRNLQLIEFVERHIKIREERNRAIIAKLAKKGFKITYEDLENRRIKPTQVLGRPHIGQILIEKGHVKNLAEAFERYLADGRSCYVESKNPSIEETIKVIQQAGGKAVLAHPHLFKKKRILKEILKKPFDGVECYYAKLSRKDAEGFVSIAKEKKWLITGGSDFHGTSKPFLYLGASFIQDEDFFQLTSHLA